ncbi:hypothetical protein [Actinopolymorpha alba]|nr:hypothetical protein [Actinopolymorpha alba]
MPELRRLGMQVNPVLRSPRHWAEGDDPLVAQIKASLHVQVLPLESGEAA